MCRSRPGRAECACHVESVVNKTRVTMRTDCAKENMLRAPPAWSSLMRLMTPGELPMKTKKTRRQFVKAAALAVAGPTLATTAAHAEGEPQSPSAAAAQRLTEIVRARHGK